ncbi:hypothetical protein AB5N19_12248 [Seiridium cardinale]
MIIMFFIAAFMASLVNLTCAASIPLASALGNLTWRGTINEHGPVVTFTGTDMQDIQRKIAEKMPGFT